MHKKLISLVLVLALVSVASAGSAQWNNAVDVGNWEDSSNWTQNGTTPASLPPGTGDFAAPYPADGGFTAVTINLSSSQSVGRVKWQHNTSTLNINSGGVLLNNGSIGGDQAYNDTADTININNGGSFIAEGSSGSTYGLITGSGTHTININSGGFMGAYGTTSHLSSNVLWLGGTSAGSGTTTINVYGVLDVDSITLANSNDVIKLYAGGVINVYGTLTNPQFIVYGEIGTPVNMDGIITDPTPGPLYGLTVTEYIGVPEPATLLLLAFGGMFLRRSRCH